MGYNDREFALKCVGKGWSELINKLFDEMPTGVSVLQVKEKFGGLRFYVEYINVSDEDIEKFENLISWAETESFERCEDCGTTESVDTRASDGKYWIVTLCENCRIKSP
jgi:hypothetical protein